MATVDQGSGAAACRSGLRRGTSAVSSAGEPRPRIRQSPFARRYVLPSVTLGRRPRGCGGSADGRASGGSVYRAGGLRVCLRHCTQMRPRQLASASLGKLGAVTVWLALLGVVTTPYLIHHLGASLYGIFALLTIMSAYLSNLELGFGHATVRFLARARALEDADEERVVLETSFAVFLAASAIASAAALAAQRSSRNVRPRSRGPAPCRARQRAARLPDPLHVTARVLRLGSAHGVGTAPISRLTRAIFGTLASLVAVWQSSPAAASERFWRHKCWSTPGRAPCS